ncbi:MAG TPA: SpoIIE family protein phosphatase [Gaiellaceae bacterium]|nr:SpoIIE family protein phosphatase [Gaiellaceae bacterium]
MSDRLESLFSLAAEVTAAQSEAEVLSVIVTEGVELAEASAAVVGLLDGDFVKLAAAVGYPEGYLDRWAAFPLEAGTPMADVIASKEPLYCSSREERDQRWPRFRGTGNAGSEAFVVLPLAGRDVMLGALTLSYDDKRAFEHEERVFIEAFSAQCALALERARATAAEFVSRTRTERLQRFTARLAPALTVSAVTEIAIDKALNASGGKAAVLALGSDDGRRIELVAVGGTIVSDEMRSITVLPSDHGSALGEVFRGREPLWLGDREAWEHYPTSIGRPAALRAAAVLPVATADRFFGVLAIAFDSGRPFPDAERRFLLAIAGQTAQALDRARLYEEQSHIAHVLQQSLLPKAVPSLRGVELATRYHAVGRATATGGDFYDVFEAGGSHFVVIGDVCGKGPKAAALTALCRHTLRACVSLTPDTRPSELLTVLNRIMLENNSTDPNADIEFASVTCMLLETTGKKLTATLSSGGHPPTLVRRDAGSIDSYGPTGPLIGVDNAATFTEHIVEFEPGDMVILHTDGLTDARDEHGNRVGEESLRATIESLALGAGPETLVSAFDALLEGLEIADDIAIVALQSDKRPAPPTRATSPARKRLRELDLA